MLVTVSGLMGPSMETLKKQEWTEVSRRNNVYNAKFSVETRLEDGFAIENTYFTQGEVQSWIHVLDIFPVYNCWY